MNYLPFGVNFFFGAIGIHVVKLALMVDSSTMPVMIHRCCVVRKLSKLNSCLSRGAARDVQMMRSVCDHCWVRQVTMVVRMLVLVRVIVLLAVIMIVLHFFFL